MEVVEGRRRSNKEEGRRRKENEKRNRSRSGAGLFRLYSILGAGAPQTVRTIEVTRRGRRVRPEPPVTRAEDTRQLQSQENQSRPRLITPSLSFLLTTTLFPVCASCSPKAMPNKGQNRRPKGFMADKKPSQERMKPSVKEKEKEQKEQKPKDKDKK